MAVVVARFLLFPSRAHSVYPNFSGAASRWMLSQSLYTTTRDYDYRYSPAVAVGFVPLRLIGDRAGILAWCSVNALVLLTGMVLWMKRDAPRAVSGMERGIILLLLLPLALGNIADAQSNCLVIGLLLLALAAVEAGAWNTSACLIGIAFLFKLYPLAMGLLLVLLYPRKMAWRLPLAIAAGLLLPFLFQHREYVAAQYHDWARYLLAEDRGDQDVGRAYRDLQFVLRDLHAPIPLAAYRIIELAAAALIALTCLRARLAGWKPARVHLLVLTLAVCWMTALGPATEAATYVLVAPVVCWLLVARRAERPSAGWWLVLLVYLMLLYLPFAGLFPGRSVLRSPQLKSLHPAAVLVLLGMTLWDVWAKTRLRPHDNHGSFRSHEGD